jgi:hypothetical protein
MVVAADEAGSSGLSADEFQATIATLATPDVVESPFGQLHFFDGVPTAETASTVYDALDMMRGSGIRHDGQRVKQRKMNSLLGTTKPRASFVVSQHRPRLWNHGRTAEDRET